MSILSELNSIIIPLGLPVETGIFSGVPPDEYAVLTPLTDDFPLFGDDKPIANTAEVRVSLFSRGNYLARAVQLTAAFISADFTVTARRYVGYDGDSAMHNYCVDVSKNYEWSVT
jgi:hypothetical protein